MKTFMFVADDDKYNQFHGVVVAETEIEAEALFRRHLAANVSHGGPWKIGLNAVLNVTTPGVAWFEFTGE